MIQDSLLNRVRATLATTARPEERFRRVAPVTVAATGEIDIATSPQLRDAVETAFNTGARAVRIDLSRTTFMDSSGLHVLLDASRRAAETGRRLTIDSPPDNIRRVIEIAGLAEMLPLTSYG